MNSVSSTKLIIGPAGLGMRVVGLRRQGASAVADSSSGGRSNWADPQGISHTYKTTELSAFLTECDYVVSLLPDSPATRGP